MFVTEATQCSFQGGLKTRKLSQTPVKPLFVTGATQCSVHGGLQTRKLSQSPPPVKRVIHSAKSPKKSMIPVRISESREVGIQTGGILTVRQKSTQNYIPKGRHQLQRSPRGRKRQEYGNTGYRLFQWVIQNWKDFCLKINIPRGNY